MIGGAKYAKNNLTSIEKRRIYIMHRKLLYGKILFSDVRGVGEELKAPFHLF